MQQRQVLAVRGKRLPGWATASCLLLLMVFAAACRAEPFVLVGDGVARATIVIARPQASELPNDNSNAQSKTIDNLDTARELQDYVKRSTGAELPIVFDDQDVRGPRVLVGESRYTRDMGLRSEDFERQEYLIRVTPEAVVLIGRDETYEQFLAHTLNGSKVHLEPHPLETFEAIGTQYAEQDFLEKFVGVRWYFMGALGEVVPEHDSITIEPVEIRRKPDTKFRELYISGIPPKYYWEPTLSRGPGWDTDPELVKYNDTRRIEASVWGRHLKMGGTPMALNHSFHIPFAWGFLKVDETTYPGRPDANAEWRDWPLLTSPAVVDGFVRTAEAYFDGTITGLPPFSASGDYYSVAPHDTESWGNHPDTLKWIDRKYPDAPPGPRSISSNYYWPFVARVAERVKQTHPDKFISALAYRTYMFPPDPDVLERLPDNVALGLSLGTSARDRDPTPDNPYNERWVVGTWAKLVNPELMFEWRYLLWPTNPNYRAFPDVAPIAMGRMVRTMKEFGVRGGVFMQIDENHGTWWSFPVLDHLRVYVAAKMLDDWTLNEDDIVDEYYRLFYGPAERPMRMFWEYLHDTAYNFDPNQDAYNAWLKDHPGAPRELWDWTVKCPPEHLARLGKLFEEGRRLTEPDSIYRKRVELIHDAVYQAYLVRASRETLAGAPKEAVEERPRPFFTE